MNSEQPNFSPRAEVLYRRTYSRPYEHDDTKFESPAESIYRVVGHQQWLWERAKGSELSRAEMDELMTLHAAMMSRQAMVAGRTLWLGGTEVARRREASNFNCSFMRIETVHDFVDFKWLLLQGCGVGGIPVPGTLSGFTRPIRDIEIIRSTRTEKGGHELNVETVENGIWTIQVGDSAESWAKALGKLLAGKASVRKLVFDFSQIRPAGTRLKGYGWISSGDEAISKAFTRIAEILNQRAGQLLTRMNILDVANLLGTVLSSRRSAEIMLMDYGQQEWQEFARAKREFWLHDAEHRQQSNNSLIFWKKPTKRELREIFELIRENGGSEPGIVNGEAAIRRAPWFAGVNPCAEILLPNRGFCNLVELDIGSFVGRHHAMQDMARLIARANYRQTLVDLHDGILQDSWHQNNEFLHLCGVGLTGVVRRPDMDAYAFRQLRNSAVLGAYSMADELGTPRPKNVTTIKPSGTISKVMGRVGREVPEGVHRPLGRYILNAVNFSRHETIIPALAEAGYRIIDHPTDRQSVLVTFPVDFSGVQFDMVDGKEVNLESAVSQLERYRLLMDNYVDQNCSITVSYGDNEIPEIVDWLDIYWESYVAVSFLPRLNPSLTAKDLGYPYLPQEVVTREQYDAYETRLRPVDMAKVTTSDTLDDACATGACPIR